MSLKTTEDIRQTIQRMVDKLVAEYQPEKIILFGSHAHGEPDSGSDIDLLIIKNTSERFVDRCSTVRQILTEPGRGIPLDVIVLTPEEVDRRLSVGDHFVRDMTCNGEVLYAA